MGIFLKRSKGSITVLVTLILIPTVFFTGFLVDLARLKLYGNQAVMTADNYGETVMAQYDNLLKELYGLFAVTQDEQALKQLDNLEKYMKNSFDPSANTISWGHLEEAQALWGKSSYEGFMPYKSAKVELSHEFVPGADLGSHEVMSTQIGDFMKFRIAQQLIGNDFDVIEALDAVQGTEDNARAIDKKLEIDKKAEEIYKEAREYYLVLKDFTGYPDYIKEINQSYGICKTDFSTIVDSDSYKVYYAYKTCDQQAMKAAVEKRDRIEKAVEEEPEEEEGDGSLDSEDQEDRSETPQESRPAKETLTEAEQKLVDIYDAWKEDENAREDKLEKKFDRIIGFLEASTVSDPIDFGNYGEKLYELKEHADRISSKAGELQTLKGQLQEMLQDKAINEDLKSGLQEELDRMNKLFDQIDRYTGIARYIDENNTAVNSGYQQQVIEMADKLGEIKKSLLNCEEKQPDYPATLDGNKWKRFDINTGYKKLYDSLEECFGNEGEEGEARRKKKEADKLLKDTQNQMEESEESPARDIPAQFGYGMPYHKGFNLAELVGEAVDCFSMNNFLNEANKLLLKVYTVQYDFGMFSSRVTNAEKEEGEEDREEQTAVSLTGYAMASDINYLYQAELEYILGGSNSSDENLNAARNKILAIRSVANFTATYSVKEVNTAIQSISKAAAAVNPILGLVVNGALRVAVAGVETAYDWEELKAGESVALFKTKLKQLTACEKFSGLLNLSEESGAGGNKKEGLQMNYEQYLMVMLVFLTSSDTISERTANLIELNVNTVKQGIGKSGELSRLEFKMENAHTAVSATCKVHMNFVVMPKGFAKAVASGDDYDSLVEFEKNSYQFTVTRGY